MNNTIKVKVTAPKGVLGKTQTARFLANALAEFNPEGVDPVTILVRDGENSWTLEPLDRVGHTAVEEIMFKVTEAGLPHNIKQDILDLIRKSHEGADPERNGFAEEMALQYGFTTIDDDGDIFAVTRERLADMMSVLGFRCGAERRAEREKQEAAEAGQTVRGTIQHAINTLMALRPSLSYNESYCGEPAGLVKSSVAAWERTDPMAEDEERVGSGPATSEFDRLLYAFGQAAIALKGGYLSDMPEAKAVKAAFEKAKRDSAQVGMQWSQNAVYGKFRVPEAGSRKGDEYASAHNMLMKLACAAAAKPNAVLARLPEFQAAENAVFKLLDNLLNAELNAANKKLILNSCWGKMGAIPVGGVLGSGESDSLVKVRKGYTGLLNILVEALNQAQQGKGAERHNLGGDLPFEKQRMQSISELVGSVDGMSYQACKKITEGVNLPTLDRQVAELLGAINYIAGMIVFLRKRAADATDARAAEYRTAVDNGKAWAKPMNFGGAEEARIRSGKTDAQIAEDIIAGKTPCQWKPFNVDLSVFITEMGKKSVREICEIFGFDIDSVSAELGTAANPMPVGKPDENAWQPPPADGTIPKDIHANTFVEVRFGDEHSFESRACLVNWQLRPEWRVVDDRR